MAPTNKPLNRRRVLALGVALLGYGAATVRAKPVSTPTGAEEKRPPRDVGRKFFSNGQVHPFAGNTIICHVPQQGENAAFKALLDVYREVPACSFSRKVTMLPPSSYHMTIFGGANDQDRKPGLWPADVPLDAPMDECNRILGERLMKFRLDCELPLRMKVDMAERNLQEKPLTMRLLPFDHDENVKLRRLRSRLSEVLKIRLPEPDTYRFHITLGYLIDWLTAEEQSEYAQALSRWRAAFNQKCPVIELAAPEYCLLDDMFAFDRQFYLQA